MKPFTKNDTQALRELINQRLSEDLLLYKDIKIHAGNARYTDNEIEFKLTVTRKGYDPLAESWNKMAEYHGLPADALHKTVMMFNGPFQRGTESKILGLAIKNRKYPVIVEREGKQYKTSLEELKRAKDSRGMKLEMCGIEVKCLTDKPNYYYPDGPSGAERDHNRPY